jgi:exosortase/archaeosortase family protein
MLLKTVGIAAAGCLIAATQHMAAFSDFHDLLSQWVAVACGRLTSWFGMPVYVDHTTLHSLDYSVRVTPPCNGSTGALLSVVAACVIRGSLWTKLRWAAGLLSIVTACNVLRVITVLVVGTRSARWGTWAHDWVLPAIWMALGAVLWSAWLKKEIAQDPAVYDNAPA